MMSLFLLTLSLTFLDYPDPEPSLPMPSAEAPTGGQSEEPETVAESSSPSRRHANDEHPDAPAAQRVRQSSTMPYPTPPGLSLFTSSEGSYPAVVPIEVDVLMNSSDGMDFPTKTPLVVDKLPPAQQQAFYDISRPKEAASIVPHLRPLSAQEVAALDPEQLIGSRWLDVWKPTELEKLSPWPKQYEIPDEVTPKSRLIIQGYMNPQLLELQRTVAAPEGLDLMLSIQLTANTAMDSTCS